MFQMLLRGSSAVGYTNYPDNVIVQFIELEASNGIDVFRIFDCFNSVEQMKLSIDTVRKCGKIAEVCICFTGDFLDSKETIYTLEYYQQLAREVTEAGAHMIGIKDIAGLMKPQMAARFVAAIRQVTDLPLHFHAHNTSSASLATALQMADVGCEVIDLAVASMADTTSQPSMNAFLASIQGHDRDPGMDYLSLERYDQYWNQLRTLYQPFESGLKCGTARVYDHQIPGGQYSNLIAQARNLGTLHNWNEIVDIYRDVNRLFGNIVKVTPSSKCVGDMALFLISNGLTVSDILGPKGDVLDYPASVSSLCKGYLGKLHHGFPDAIISKVLKKEKPLQCRPGSMLPPIDMEMEKTRLEKKYNQGLGAEDVVSCILYPAVLDKYYEFLELNGSVADLNTSAFFYGMKVGEQVHLPASHQIITLKRVCGADLDGVRVIVFDVDGIAYQVKDKDSSCSNGNSTSNLPLADLNNKEHVGSLLPGIVDKLHVREGDKVKPGDCLVTISAMKMEVQVKANYEGVVSRVLASIGDKVDAQSLL